MQKKHFVLMLSSIITASFAFACTPEPPKSYSDRVVEIFDTVYEKVGREKNCDKLAKDLESYCKSVCVDLAGTQELVESYGNVYRDKFESSLEKFDNLNMASCIKDEKVNYAFSWCSRSTPFLYTPENDYRLALTSFVESKRKH